MKHCILDALLKSPAEFKETIRNHFKLKKDYVLKMCEKWAEEGHDSGSMCSCEGVKKSDYIATLGKIKTELAKL